MRRRPVQYEIAHDPGLLRQWVVTEERPDVAPVPVEVQPPCRHRGTTGVEHCLSRLQRQRPGDDLGVLAGDTDRMARLAT